METVILTVFYAYLPFVHFFKVMLKKDKNENKWGGDFTLLKSGFQESVRTCVNSHLLSKKNISNSFEDGYWRAGITRPTQHI